MRVRKLLKVLGRVVSGIIAVKITYLACYALHWNIIERIIGFQGTSKIQLPKWAIALSFLAGFFLFDFVLYLISSRQGEKDQKHVRIQKGGA